MTNNIESWTVRKVLRWTTDKFKEIGINTPRLDAELLIAKVIEKDRVGVYLDLLRPLTKTERDNLRALVAKRIKRIPIAYILGHKEFYGIDLAVNESVLIPRPDTELLVKIALSHLTDNMSVLDIGTGSGAVILAIGQENPSLKLYATDISGAALKTARENGKSLKIEVTWIEGSLFDPIKNQSFDLIVSNPPYINEGENLQEEIKFEPPNALFSGSDGLNHIREIVSNADNHLNDGGFLIFEFGDGQGEQVKSLLEEAGFTDVFIMNDYNNLPRIAGGKKRA